MNLAITIVLSYLLGSISFGVVFCKIFGKEDIRKFGSGNAGTTNILRTYGKGAAVAVLAGDALKGSLGCFIGSMLLSGITGMYIGGIAALVGHLFPIFFKFKGGKGIATMAGVLGYINMGLLASLLTVFIVCVFITKYVSFSSIMAAVAYPVFTYMFNAEQQYAGVMTSRDAQISLFISIGVAFAVVFMHRGNIKRLIAGTENKITDKKKATATTETNQEDSTKAE